VLIASRPALAAVSAVGVGALTLAAILQHAYGYEPCPWCVLQRLIVLAVAAVALLGAAAPPRWQRASMVAAWVVMVLSVLGFASALYQHFVAAQTASCALTMADRIVGVLRLPTWWPAMFEATARCDEADLPWLGVPFSFWGAFTFSLTGLGGAAALFLTRALSSRDSEPQLR
jgi:disulfide bond formation protein DsbB